MASNITFRIGDETNTFPAPQEYRVNDRGASTKADRCFRETCFDYLCAHHKYVSLTSEIEEFATYNLTDCTEYRSLLKERTDFQQTCNYEFCAEVPDICRSFLKRIAKIWAIINPNLSVPQRTNSWPYPSFCLSEQTRAFLMSIVGAVIAIYPFFEDIKTEWSSLKETALSSFNTPAIPVVEGEQHIDNVDFASTEEDRLENLLWSTV